MGAKADNHTGFGHKKQYTASSDRGTQRNSDNAKLRYVNSLVIVFVIIFVTVILSDLRYIYCGTYIFNKVTRKEFMDWTPP